MDLKPEILDKCNLLQACEWIAFGWEPMKPIYEHAIGRRRFNMIKPDGNRIVIDGGSEQLSYNENINSALGKLELAIYTKQIIAYGITDFGLEIQKTDDTYLKTINNARFMDKDIVLNKEEQELYNFISNKPKVFPIEDVSENFNTNIITNEMSTGDTFMGAYHNIEIEFSILKKVFPCKKNLKSTNNVSEMASINAKHPRKQEQKFVEILEKEPERITANKYELIIDKICNECSCSLNTAKNYYTKYNLSRLLSKPHKS